jgi:hypothetical protein
MPSEDAGDKEMLIDGAQKQLKHGAALCFELKLILASCFRPMLLEVICPPSCVLPCCFY